MTSKRKLLDKIQFMRISQTRIFYEGLVLRLTYLCQRAVHLDNLSMDADDIIFTERLRLRSVNSYSGGMHDD